MFIRFALVAAALAGGTGLALAQTAPEQNPGAVAPQHDMVRPPAHAGEMGPGPNGMHGMTMGGGGMAKMHPGTGRALPPDHIEGRIAFLKTELGITEAQSTEWNAFADALRSGAKGRQAAMAQALPATASAPERAEATMQRMSAALESMKVVVAAEKPLYAVLSDKQKQAADTLLAEPGMAMGGMRMGSAGPRMKGQN